MSEVREPCLRCGTTMEWRHQTWQCPRCRFKIGCCEGATAECAEPCGSDPEEPIDDLVELARRGRGSRLLGSSGRAH